MGKMVIPEVPEKRVTVVKKDLKDSKESRDYPEVLAGLAKLVAIIKAQIHWLEPSELLKAQQFLDPETLFTIYVKDLRDHQGLLVKLDQLDLLVTLVSLEGKGEKDHLDQEVYLEFQEKKERMGSMETREYLAKLVSKVWLVKRDLLVGKVSQDHKDLLDTKGNGEHLEQLVKMETLETLDQRVMLAKKVTRETLEMQVFLAQKEK